MEADLFHNLHLELQERMRNPSVIHAEIMGDIIYFYEAIKQPDAQEFVKAIVNEFETTTGNWDRGTKFHQTWTFSRKCGPCVSTKISCLMKIKITRLG